jgi:Icc-related predicted phosphoesterase
MEFRKELPPIKNIGSDVLVLAGDICVAHHLYRHPRGSLPNNAENGHKAALYREFLQYCSDNWEKVIMVAGNHEFYSGDWEKVTGIMREETQHYPNISFCDQDRVDIGDVTFLGASLWTNFNNGDPLTMMSVKDLMSDYHAITENPKEGIYHKLRPVTTFAKHNSDLDWLRTQLSLLKDRKVVVVTHHQPSFRSVHENYKTQIIMNGAFCSNLDDFIIDHPQIKLWCAGHVHNVFDYTIGKTRVVCNPRGYPSEYSGWNPQFTVEV